MDEVDMYGDSDDQDVVLSKPVQSEVEIVSNTSIVTTLKIHGQSITVINPEYVLNLRRKLDKLIKDRDSIISRLERIESDNRQKQQKIDQLKRDLDRKISYDN